jgi:hypothetical protein
MDKKTHVINVKTGYCYTCNKYENDELKGKKYTEYLTLSSSSQSSPASVSKVNQIFPENEDAPLAINYKIYENLNCSKGRY